MGGVTAATVPAALFPPGTAFSLQMLSDKTFKTTSRFGLHAPNISGKLQHLIASSQGKKIAKPQCTKDFYKNQSYP